MKKSNKVLSLILAFVMLVTSCSFGMFAFAKDGYQVTGKTDPNNRWSFRPDSAVTDTAANLWATASTALGAIPALEGIDFSKGLDDLANKKLYTNSMIRTVYQLYGLIGTASDGKYEMLAELAAAGVMSSMPEDKYAAIREKFTTALSNKPSDVKGFEVVCTVAKEIENFGFEDGDRDGFEDALLVALRPITYFALSMLQADTKIQYEAIQPVLVAFGVQNVQSVEDFIAAYDADTTTDAAIKADLAWRPVFDALFNYYDTECGGKNPIPGILGLLPNIAAVVESGAADTFIRTIVSHLANLNEDITTLKELVASMTFDSATINSFFANKELKFADGAIVIVLDPIDFAALASVQGYDAQAKLEAVFEILFKTITTQVFCVKTVTKYVDKLDNNGNPVYVLDGEGNPTTEIEQEAIEKKYDNWTIVAPLLAQYGDVVEGILPGAVDALKAANTYAKAGEIDKAYNEVTGIIFRTFANIKRVRLIVDGNVVSSTFVNKNGRVNVEVPADKITKATSAKSGHIINGVVGEVPARAVDDVDVVVKDRTEACKFNTVVTKAASYTVTGVKTHTCSVCGFSYTESIAKLPKKANTIKVKGLKKTVALKKVAAKAQTVKALKVTKAQGKVTYKLAGGNKKSRNALKLNTKNGKVTVKKGTAKGTYKITVKVTAKGNAMYKAKTKKATVTVVVR